MRVLPRDSVDFLRRLTVLSVEDSSVAEVPKVSGLRSLKLLRVDGSEVRALPAFKDLPSLRYLHVSNSKLARLDTGVLENLDQLVLANFTANEISWIHPRAFRYMERMQEVSMTRVFPLEEIKKTLCLTHTRQVSLRGNQLRDAAMVGRAMRALKTLKRLDLSKNEIGQLRQASFMDVISLERLDLSNNRLTELQRTALHRMPRLKKVDLSRNNIKAFHRCDAA